MSREGHTQTFVTRSAGVELAGEAEGSGAPVVLAHGLTASRRYVLHGSRVLPRRGFRTIAYDARGHGESGPAPAAGGYAYEELADDLAAVISGEAEGEPAVLVGHSMGAHAIAALAARAQPPTLRALVLVGPAWDRPATEQELARWDGLADGLERGGVEGFIEAYDDGLEPRWRETLVRIARQRLAEHRDTRALARALREVPRSDPVSSLEELERISVPSLVVASRDEADPSHPRAVAEAWAERIPAAELAIEDEGDSPLAWQGGRLSRAIAEFLG